jgi:P27 family predicted phage terminase small subunit
LPRASSHLSDEEKSKWKLLVKELHPLGLLTSLDLDALERYCVLYVRWVKAERMVREKGEIKRKKPSRYPLGKLGAMRFSLC